jgi:hypothetical protein
LDFGVLDRPFPFVYFLSPFLLSLSLNVRHDGVLGYCGFLFDIRLPISFPASFPLLHGACVLAVIVVARALFLAVVVGLVVIMSLGKSTVGLDDSVMESSLDV